MIIGIPIIKLVFNPFIFIIIIVLAVVAFVIIERWRALGRVKFDTKKFTQDIKGVLQKKGGLQKAVEICEAENHPLANVIKEGLRSANLGREDVYDAMDEAHLRERGILERRVGVLTISAFIAPLLGLFGTVVGIIQAFSAMAAAGGADPTAMLNGIAVALLTTACGIIVAVPAAIFFGIFSGKVDAISSEIEIGTKNIIIALSETVWKGGKKIKK
jgi:biopolymer transport protein ExbB